MCAHINEDAFGTGTLCADVCIMCSVCAHSLTMCTVCAQTSAQCVLYVLKHHLLRAGINVLIKIMAKMARKEEQSSVIDNYERLEFLGDAVVEFVTTVHLYFMLPDAPEGVLATYRTAIVQNQHLTELAKVCIHGVSCTACTAASSVRRVSARSRLYSRRAG